MTSHTTSGHPLTIRPMTAQDIPALAQLMAETPLWQRDGVTKTGARQRFQEGLAAGATILVAQVGNEQAGFLWYATRGAFLRSGYVVLLGVGAAWRGMGRAPMAQGEAAMFQEAVCSQKPITIGHTYSTLLFLPRIGPVCSKSVTIQAM